MIDWLFYIFSALTVISAIFMVSSRNAVNAALFMIVSFVGTAALFVLLNAYLLAILQILVYAGAVVVLFLFVIMLLNAETMEKRKTEWISMGAGFVAFSLLISGLMYVLVHKEGQPSFISQGKPAAADAVNFGYELFGKYQLPFELTGILLLIAMIGVIILCKKETKTLISAKAPQESPMPEMTEDL